MEEIIAPPRPRFQNLAKLLWGSLTNRFFKTQAAHFAGNLADLVDPRKLVVVYVGHATTYINFFGTKILTDPIFGNRVGGLIRRRIAPGLTLNQIPALDLVLVSHPHLDHFDKVSLRALASRAQTLVIPKNSRDLVAGMPFPKIIESDWGNTREVADVQITTFQPRHWGARFPWEKIQRGYNSYLLQKNNFTILFAGDSGYTPAFAEIAKTRPIDLAFLPITAYNPPEFQRYHMSPEDAVKIFLEINAQYLIPIHWGAFRLSLEPMDEPPRLIRELMAKTSQKNKLKLLYPGQVFALPENEK